MGASYHRASLSLGHPGRRGGCPDLRPPARGDARGHRLQQEAHRGCGVSAEPEPAPRPPRPPPAALAGPRRTGDTPAGSGGRAGRAGAAGSEGGRPRRGRLPPRPSHRRRLRSRAPGRGHASPAPPSAPKAARRPPGSRPASAPPGRRPRPLLPAGPPPPRRTPGPRPHLLRGRPAPRSQLPAALGAERRFTRRAPRPAQPSSKRWIAGPLSPFHRLLFPSRSLKLLLNRSLSGYCGLKL